MSKLPQKVHRQYLLKEAEHFRDHKKGIPEWIKNSDDSYARHEENKKIDTSDLPIIINLNKDEIVCLDFGGADGEDIEEHIPFYGSPDAASHGKKELVFKVSGGHGNGGKYYALSQFQDCEIISYYNRKLTILRINKTGDYMDVKNEEMPPADALKKAGFHKWEYFNERKNSGILFQIRNGTLNFFLWKGLAPRDIKSFNSKKSISNLVTQIANNPQSRSALRSRNVDILHNGRIFWPKLKPDEVEPDETFGSREFVLPNEIEEYKFNTKIPSVLKVILSKEPLTGDKSSLNILEIFSFKKNIAFYEMPQLLMDKGLSKYLYASIDCPELKENGCVTNDRIYLIENDLSRLFLNWCTLKIKEVLDDLTNKEKKKEETKQLKELGLFLKDITQELQDLLEEDNLIKPAFEPLGEELNVVDVATNEGGYGTDKEVKNKGGGKRLGGKEKRESPSTEKKSKSNLKILVSNLDTDPLNPGKTFDMIERQPILFQRLEDIDYGIWWINSQKSYVRKIKIRDPGAIPFYFFLVKEIVLAHRMRRRYKEQTRYDPDGLEELNFQLIDEIFNKVVQKLGIELSQDETVANKIREAIKDKKQFTISEIFDETGIPITKIHAFIASPENGVFKNFKLKKQREGGRKVNVYERIH